MLTYEVVVTEIERERQLLATLAAERAGEIVAASAAIADALSAGHTVYFTGNGGSASQALHLSAELVGRFRSERRPLPAMALCENTATLTAIANDYGYDEVFSRQVEAFCRSGDVLVLLSTSGSSANVLEAAKKAAVLKVLTIGLTGFGGGDLARLVDILIDVPSTDVAHVQEVHLLVGHLLCSVGDDIVERTPALSARRDDVCS